MGSLLDGLRELRPSRGDGTDSRLTSFRGSPSPQNKAAPSRPTENPPGIRNTPCRKSSGTGFIYSRAPSSILGI